MKRIIAVLYIIFTFFVILNCCAKDRSNEGDTTTVFENVSETTSEALIEEFEPAIEEITTTQPVTHAEAGEIIINEGEYRYKINKTDFEKRFDEELLLKISEMIPMEFGYEDYEKWDSSANVILNDVILGASSRYDCRLERYDFFESEQAKKAQAEMMSYSEEMKFHEYFVTDIPNINEYLIKLFGPNAGVIDKNDFEDYSVITNSEKYPFEDYDYNYRFVYLPESKLVVCGVNEFLGEESRTPYMCDVQEKDGLYIVRAVSGSYGYDSGNDFLSRQNYALEILGWYWHNNGKLEEVIYTIACDDNGNMYMKSTEKSYILPENAEKNYYAVSDAEIKVRKYYTDEWTVVDSLSKNEKVYSPGLYFGGERFVVTEEYVGIVEEELLKEIE